ncbi:amidohydrolase family protein [Paenibacillus sp. J2TS4]|uniref:amidohydrolase family protein n=1 Tax=Paenibacillus sp. J2TS4 TaxID=2807194 RepID=UPI001B2007EB|nr:amidohydrolase family protein [Paenibacillus sp. J2TS4]GIP34816.1 hypothetical protein J2TS4_40260 [Paenibacillus sp. J2TS4]
MSSGALFDCFAKSGAVDVTAFMGQWPFRHQAQASAADLIAMADRYGLAGICVSHIASIFGHDTHAGNAALFAETAADGRLWPFAILNPAESDGWERELEYAEQSGTRGIRLLPGNHGYGLGDQRVAELVSALRKRQLPLAVCVRLQDERLQHPRYPAETVPLHALAELIARCEGHPLLISGLREYEWSAVLRLQTENWHLDRVICDLWHVNGPLAVISQLVERRWASTFAFSSCEPLQEAGATALQLAAAGISDPDRLALCRDNALRWLNG